MTVSIIVPIYGVEKYIEECAVSLFSQTYPDIQYIFVDDGSPDRSIPLLEELLSSRFAQLKDRVTIVRKENSGLPRARLTGLQYAKGDYILHVDSDDYLQTDAIEKLVLKAEQTKADIVYFYVCKELGGGRRHISKDKVYTSGPAFSSDIFTFRAHGFAVNKFVRGSLYSKNLFYPTQNMHEDVVLMGQVAFYASSVALLPEALYHYRRYNPGAITRRKKSQRRTMSATNFLDLYEFYRGKLSASPLAFCKDAIISRCVNIGVRFAPQFFTQRPYLYEYTTLWQRFVLWLKGVRL